ncbi:MAG: PD40 domain-containing protein [Fibrobacterales bacterium]|nr:PD40 domain-containing protein [Fibrobacterales bacterium]
MARSPRSFLPLAAALFLLPAALFASDRSVATEHFKVHYPSELRPYAERVAQIAEAVHDTLTRRYGMELPQTVELIVENGLAANGYANPATNRICVNASDWGFSLRSTHDWLRNVVTHEFSHIISLGKGARTPGWLYGVFLSYSDYFDEAKQQNAAFALPFRAVPAWFSEGTAQYETERMGFEVWDSHRDMILRLAVLDSALFPLSEMGQFVAEDDIDLERGPYTQGYALVRYIAKRWGDEAVVRIWKELSRWSAGGFSGAVRNVTGLKPERLYEEWKADLERHYRAQADTLGELSEGRTLTAESWFQDLPRYDARGGLWFVSNFGSPAWDGALARVPDSVLEASRSDTAFKPSAPSGAWRADEGFRLDKPYLERGYDVWAPADSSSAPRRAYVTYKYRDKKRKRHLDLLVQDSSATGLFKKPADRRLTRLADAVHPAFSRDGRSLAYARRDPNSGTFSLWIARLDEKGGLDGEPKLLVEAPRDERTGNPAVWNFGVLNPKWSPDGSRVAFGLFDGERRRVAVADTSGAMRVLPGAGGADERDPDWLDNSTLVVASDRGGVFNLWRVPVEGGIPRQITRMRGGAFSPAVSPDGKRIAFVGYDRSGFSLRETDARAELPEGGMLAEKLPSRALDLAGGERSFSGRDRAYLPLPTRFVLMPLVGVEERARSTRGTGDGKRSAKVGVHVAVDDALARNTVTAVAQIEVSEGLDFFDGGAPNPKQQKDLFLLWENRSFPVVSKAGFLYRNIHSEDTLVSEDKGHPTSVAQYAVLYKALEERLEARGLGFNDTLSLWGGWENGKFDLYEDGFEWDFYEAWRVGLGWSWFSTAYLRSSAETLFQPSGPALFVSAEHRWAGLYRAGKFYESFVIDESGGMPRARLHDWNVLDASASVYFGFPWLLGVTSAQGSLQAVPWWDAPDAPGDTLDAFFLPAQKVAGFPYYADDEECLLQGRWLVLVELRHTFPLWSSRFSRGGFAHRGAALSLYAQAGRGAEEAADLPEFGHLDWHRGVGAELRLSQRVFYGVPLEVWFGAQKALNRIPYRGGMREVERLGRSFLPDFLAPTGLEFGVSLQFLNPGLGNRSLRNREISLRPH